MACQKNEAGAIAGMASTNPSERLDAVDTALNLGLDSIAVGESAKAAISVENDGVLGPAIINGLLQVVGNVGAANGGMEPFLLSVISDPPIISYESAVVEYAQPEYSSPGDPFPIDPQTGVMWDPLSGQPYPMPTGTPATATTVLDSIDNKASVKSAAITALETINSASTTPEDIVDALLEDLEVDIEAIPEDDVGKLEQQAASTFRLCSAVSKKVDRERRNKMGNKIRDKFYKKGKKRLGCGPAAYVGAIIVDQGAEALPLDPIVPNDNDIAEVMDGGGGGGGGSACPPMSDPTILLTCPSGRVLLGEEIDFAPTITNSKAELVMSKGVVVGDVSQMDISIDFGDGSDISLTFKHAYASTGQFSASATVVDNFSGYTTTEICDVVVYTPVDVTVTDTTVNDDSIDVIVCASVPIVVTSSDVTTTPPCSVISVPKVNPVILTFEDEYGDPTNPPRIVISVVIAQNPIAVSLSSDGVQCAKSEKQFGLEVSGVIDGFDVWWSVDGEFESGSTTLVRAFGSGLHSVYAVVVDGAGRWLYSGTEEFEVYPEYDAYLSYTSVPFGTDVVPGLTINFDVCITMCSGAEIPPLEISCPDGATRIAYNTCVFPGPGKYDVFVPPYVEEQITVYGPPVITIKNSASSVCDGLVEFSVDVTSGREPHRISLDTGDGVVYQVVNGHTLSHQYKSNGTYVATLTVKDDDDIVSVAKVVSII